MLDIPADARAARTWGNDILLQVQDVGAFVRVLLPVRLTDDHTVTFGTWLGVAPDDLRAAWEVWEKPEYSSLELTGRLANAIPPWGEAVLAQPARAQVIDADALPYVTGADGDVLGVVLSREWPHEEILDAIDAAMGST